MKLRHHRKRDSRTHQKAFERAPKVESARKKLDFGSKINHIELSP